jgi:3-phenylpropionate/trans-cinnamate dioxygenase ferredoxin reductase subunit
MGSIVIIGNGIAGITAARHIRKKSDQKIIVISAESKYFFSRTALMYVFMGQLKFEHTQPYEDWFWKKNRIELIQDTVVNIDTAKSMVRLQNGEKFKFSKLILALGSKPNDLPILGATLKGVQPLYSKQHLELLEQQSKTARQAVIIGGGLIGIELAEMLHSRGIEAHMVIREQSFWDIVLPPEESKMITQHIKNHEIHLHLGKTVNAINGDSAVESITLDDGSQLKADLVGVTIGVSPNIALIKPSNIETDRGILVNEYLETNIDNIYAIGDCAQLRNPPKGRKAIEPVWYTGRMMGETIAETLTSQPTPYNPGIWFNSAKFFDIEYQTYGTVPNTTTPEYESLYWEDRKDERALRIVYNKAKEVVGVNSLGIRIRHEVADAWITHKIKIEDAMLKLSALNFEQEFAKKFEREINLNPTTI